MICLGFLFLSMTGEMPNESKLNNPPDDGISAVKFGPGSSQFLLVSSWDSTVRLYDVSTNFMRMKYNHSAAVLDCCFQDNVHAFSGGLDKCLRAYDFNTNSGTYFRSIILFKVNF